MAKRKRDYLNGEYHVELVDGRTITVDLTLVDTLRYEAMMKASPLAGVADQKMINMAAITKLVWIAARRTGLVDHRRYGDFEADLVDLWEEDDADEADDPGEDDDRESGVALPDPTESEPTVD